MLKARIDEYDADQAARKKLEESGDLDAFMASLEKSGGDSKAKLQQNYGSMLKEEKRLQQLIEFTKPVDFMAKIGPATTVSSSFSFARSEISASAKEAAAPSAEAAVVVTATSLNTEDKSKDRRILGPSLPPP